MDKKSNFLISSGPYDINALGATKSIDLALIKNISERGFKVSWAGRGKCEGNFDSYNLRSRIKNRFIERVYNKLQRMIFPSLSKKNVLNDFIAYDKKLAKKIRNGKIPVDNNTIIIGRNAMSLYSFQEAKKKGATTVLHSQWMHPFIQQECLKKGFTRLGISEEPITQARIQRQLDEIEEVDIIWGISSLVTESYLKHGIPKEKILQVNLGVDFDRYNQCAQTPQESDLFTILFVGNVNPEKGVDLLLEAVLQSSLSNIKIIFNGAVAPYFKDIFNSYVEKLKLNNVQVLASPGDPRGNYANSSILVLPSIHESFGLVVPEAMAAGLPVIVSSSVGAKDCVKAGINGIVFESGNIEALKDAIMRFYNEKELVSEMAKEAINGANEHDWSYVSRKLISELQGS